MTAFVEQHPAKKKRVLILCPHALVREGLRLVLAQEEDLRVVGTVGETSQATETVAQLNPDIVIVLHEWSGKGTARLIRQLKADRPALPVLVLSPEPSPPHVQEILQAGAAGFLPLEAHPDEFIWAVYAVCKGKLSLHPKIVLGLLSHLADRETGETGVKLSDFSPREQEVLACLVRGLSDRDIAQELFISVRTAQTHLAHIYAKMNVHSRTEAALIAARAGWFSQRPESQHVHNF